MTVSKRTASKRSKRASSKRTATKRTTTKRTTAKRATAKKATTKKTTAKKSSPKKATAKKAAPGKKAATKAAAKRAPAKRATRPFEVRTSKIQGRGVFATRNIPQGTRLIEYTGEIVDEDEADRRYPFTDDERHHTFLFRLDNGMNIDAGPKGNAAKYINHSCDPNCEATEQNGRIFIDAVEDIKKGEELVYDYNFILDEPHNAANKRLYPCNCGSKNCRGTILAKKR